MAKGIELPEPPPYTVRITYEHGEYLELGLWTEEQVADAVSGATKSMGGFYGFTDPNENYPNVSFRRDGIIYVQVFKTNASR